MNLARDLSQRKLEKAFWRIAMLGLAIVASVVPSVEEWATGWMREDKGGEA